MARPIITIPQSVEAITEFNWHLDTRSQKVGTNLAGNDVDRFNNLPRWVGSMEMVFVGEPAAQWQAIIAETQGRYGILKLPMRNYACGYEGFTQTQVTFSNGQTFSNGKGFSFDPFFEVITAGAVGRNDMKVRSSHAPKPGQIVSHNFNPYWVTSVTPNASNYDITVQPAFRERIPTGQLMQARPYGLFEVTGDMQGRLSYGSNRHATPSLQVQEVLKR